MKLNLRAKRRSCLDDLLVSLGIAFHVTGDNFENPLHTERVGYSSAIKGRKISSYLIYLVICKAPVKKADLAKIMN